jgi:hypothetical protein
MVVELPLGGIAVGAIGFIGLLSEKYLLVSCLLVLIGAVMVGAGALTATNDMYMAIGVTLGTLLAFFSAAFKAGE